MNADEALNSPDVERQAVTLIDKGQLLNGLGQSEQALACFDKAVMICRGASDKSDQVALVLAQALDNKGNALVDLERLTEAIPCFDEAIQVHTGFVRGDGTWTDVREIALTVMNKGRALMILGRHVEAQACYEQAIDGFEQCESDGDLALAWLNFGELYIGQERFLEALAALNQSITHWEAATAGELDSAKSDYAYTLYCRADVLLHIRRYNEALDSSDQSVALHRAVVGHTNSLEDRNAMAQAVNARGHILTKLGRIQEAQECFREAERLKQKKDGPCES